MDSIKFEDIEINGKLEEFKKNLEKINDTENPTLKIPLELVFKFLFFISSNNSGENKIFYYKMKVILLENLWPFFLRRSIELLRDNDKRDLGSYKDDLGLLSLEEYFKEFSKFEELLFGADEFQRDHIIHVFRVYLLGIYLIFNTEKVQKIRNFDQIMIGDVKVCDDFKNEENEKFAIWTIIALTHDLGYPLEKLEKINQRVGNMMKYYGTSNFIGLKYNLPLQGQFLNDYILRYISSNLLKHLEESKCKENINEKSENITLYNIRIQSKYYTKFSNSFEKLSHGIISCILLMKNLTFFLESDYTFNETRAIKYEDGRQFLIRREILRAIASHDCDDIYHFNMKNFSFLLIICDELQEWDRPYSSERNEILIRSQLFIRKFTFNQIDCIIKYSENQENFLGIIKRKVRKFIRLFRSGVDSEKREFEFQITFTKREEIIANNIPSDLKENKEEIKLDMINSFTIRFLIPKIVDSSRYNDPELITTTNNDCNNYQKIKPKDILTYKED